MFPISVDPREKMKMLSAQPPCVNSFAVVPVWRCSRAIGLAKPSVGSTTVTKNDFIFDKRKERGSPGYGGKGSVRLTLKVSRNGEVASI